MDLFPGTDGYCIIDTETTGVDPRTARIVQIGAAWIGPDFTFQGAWGTLVDPGMRHIPAYQVHRITAGMVEGRPGFKAAAPPLLALTENRRVVGHRVGFDIAMIDAESRRAGMPGWEPTQSPIDTLALSWLMLPGLPNRRLSSVAAALRVGAHGAHDARRDAEMCAGVFAALAVRHRALNGRPAPGEQLASYMGARQAAQDAARFGRSLVAV